MDRAQTVYSPVRSLLPHDPVSSTSLLELHNGFSFGIDLDDPWRYSGMNPPRSIIIPHLLSISLPEGKIWTRLMTGKSVHVVRWNLGLSRAELSSHYPTIWVSQRLTSYVAGFLGNILNLSRSPKQTGSTYSRSLTLIGL